MNGTVVNMAEIKAHELENIPERVVVILSGGMDSTTLLYDVKNSGKEVFAITFDYGQKHSREMSCARETCIRLNVPWKHVNLKTLGRLAPSALTREEWDVPKGRYDDENMKQTVVPNRNMVMIALATSYAIGLNATAVYYGAHSGDHAIYPDCRPEFIHAMSVVMGYCDWAKVDLRVPYMNMDKGDIATRGKELGVDYYFTHSCYEGTVAPCEKCGACTERAEAFAKAGVEDPLLEYKKYGA